MAFSLRGFFRKLFGGRAQKGGAVVRRLTAPTYSISPEGIALIKHFESCLEPCGNGRLKAYPDGGGVWTIGWGTIEYPDGRAVKKGDIITKAYADELLEWEKNEKSEGIEKALAVPVTRNQFSALVSFAYNVGLYAFQTSTLLRKLNDGDIAGAAKEFPRWNKDNGKVVDGLTRRRLSEQRLFLGLTPSIVTMEEFKKRA